MRLVVDCRLKFGVGRVLRNLVPRLAPRVDELTLLGEQDLLTRWGVKAPNVRLVPFGYRVYGAGEQLRFPYWLQKSCDLLHVPHYNIPLAWRAPVSATINDLAHLSQDMPTNALQRAYARFFVSRALARSRQILTLSEFSQREIVRTFSVPLERITVAHCGVDRTVFRPVAMDVASRAAAALGCEAPYILTVTSLRPHKNVNGLLRAFQEFRQRFGVPHHLIIVGEKSGFRVNAPLLRLSGDIGRAVHFVGFVPDEALCLLYAGCSVFVYPSLYEGFGLPPLEAMACGAPVVVSTRASVPEVVGDAGLLVDPLDVSAMAEAIHSVVTDLALRSRLSARSLARASLFTWDRTAEVYLEAFRRCLAA